MNEKIEADLGPICARHGSAAETLLNSSVRLQSLISDGVIKLDGTALAVSDDHGDGTELPRQGSLGRVHADFGLDEPASLSVGAAVHRNNKHLPRPALLLLLENRGR